MAARIHHVNLPVPAGESAAVAEFYVSVLGFESIGRPQSRHEGAWLAAGDGTQVHLTERAGGPHPEQHVAYVVDDLDAIAARAAAVSAPWDDIGAGRAKVRDPAGNLVELFATGVEPT